MPLHAIEDPSKLRRIIDAMLLIGTDLDLPQLLRHIVEEARAITGARYGAIGVLNSEGTALAEFITVGLEPEEEREIGKRPKGLGVLGLLISDPQTLRVSDVNVHPDRSGFPPNHPPMTCFLGVPVRVKDDVYGNLYLTDKVGWTEFTGDDAILVDALALAAGTAVQNARLVQEMKTNAVLHERDRVALDLHDRAIQRIFGAGLTLQSMAGAVRDEGLSERLASVIADLDDTIGEIRSSIFDLTVVDGTSGIRSQVTGLLREMGELLGFDVRVGFEGPVDTAISDDVAHHLLAIVREALTNVARHAGATEASVLLGVEGGRCRLRISDDGRGMGGTGTLGGGRGMHNMRRRTEELHGHLEVSDNGDGGTVLDFTMVAR
jgi:signal transduction histidine kinase